jgi:stress response protein NST1
MNMQGKNAQNTTAKGRMMDFSPVRKTAGTISGTTNSGTTSLNGRNSFSSTSGTNNRTSNFAATNSAIASPTRARTLTSAYTYSLSERELERKKQAKKERERREEIQRQIELQNQTMDYNRRRIEAAKQELARSQAEESLRNRELRLQREIEEKQQAIAKKQAEQEALLRRQAIERENQAKQRRYELEKQRAKEELAKRKVGELPRATGRIPVGSASLAPKMKSAPTAISVASAASTGVTSAFAGATSASSRVNSLAGSATSAASAASKFKAPSPVSRIQITASPSRTLFGRIRPAKKVESEINSEAQPVHPAKAPVPTTLVSSSVRDALQNYDNYDEIEDLEALFDSVDSNQLHGEKSAPTSGNSSATMYYPTASRSNTISTLPKNQGSALTPDSIDSAFASVDQNDQYESIATVTPARSSYSFSDSEKPKATSLYAESDIANNNSNYVLGGRSPFINTDKVQKRPLANGQENFISSDFTSELLGPGSKIKDYTLEEENNSRKTIYAKNKSEKTKAKQQAVIIDDPSMRKTNLSLVFALIAMSIFGALVGAIVYFAFFQ